MEYTNNIASIILRYLQKTISIEEMKILMEWLNEKEENKVLFFQTKEVYELMYKDRYPCIEEVQESKERLLNKIRKEENESAEKNTLKKKQIQSSFAKYIAIAITSIGLTLGIEYFLTPKEKIIYSELNIESGPRKGFLTLADGTKVFLNASTKFRFPDKFGKISREVFLDGEAYFDVISNEKAPFIVHSSKQTIRVLGTRFNVMDYSEDDYAITSLVNGKIDLSTISESGVSSEPIILQPNQQVFYNKSNELTTLSNIKIDLSRTWVNKIYHFKDEPLGQIASRLEKMYGIKISILNETLKNTEFTGTFKLDQELDEVLQIINFERLFSYEIVNEEVFIK